jgi:hypothetical protein
MPSPAHGGTTALASLDYFTAALKWVTTAVGTSHPVRFGLVLLGSVGVQGLAAIIFVAAPSQPWLHAIATLPVHQMAGITFALLFTPVLLSRGTISEETQSELALLEELVKRSGLSRAERQLVYLEVLQASFKKGHRFSIIDINALKMVRETKLKEQIAKTKNVTET